MSEYSRMFDGWLTRYKLNRPLNKYELNNRLELGHPIKLPPMDKGVLRVNSSFIEYVDRYFAWRGWAAMGFAMVGGVLLYFALLFGLTIYVPPSNGAGITTAHIMFGWYATALYASMFVGVCYLLGRKDFFRYTHYPIRFNRKIRKVYIFQYNGPGGVLDVDWESAYWFVGKIRDGRRLSYDLRCHILDDAGIIRHTFSVGSSCEYRAEVLQHWEMIRRYMEESPAALPFPPLHLSINTESTLWNCFVIQAGAVNGLKSLPLMVYGSIWAFFRWISQKTCRAPLWPAEIEAACQISEDDPYRQPEPWRMAEIHGVTDEDARKSIEYTQQAHAAAQDYEQANPVPPGGDFGESSEPLLE